MHKIKMKAKHIYHYLFFCILVLLSGCMVGKKYSKPEAPASISYRDSVAADTTPLVKWFDLYQDTALQAIIRSAIDSNRDLLTACLMTTTP